MTLSLPVRFYRAVPTDRPEGLVTEVWDLDPARVALVALHCWNVGCPGGVPVPRDYWVFMGSPDNHVAMWQVVTEQIVPAMQAARQAGVAVVHVQPESVAARYPDCQPPLPPEPAGLPGPAPISNHMAERASRVHGKGYLEWEGWAQLDTAAPTRPQPGDTMVVTTRQFDAWLRARGIDTLLYTGFATNLCILDSPAAIRAMAGLGYRCVIMREGTLGVEFPDTLAARVHTEAAIRYLESWWGYSSSLADFISACRG